jgi:hypothetical protein
LNRNLNNNVFVAYLDVTGSVQVFSSKNKLTDER